MIVDSKSTANFITRFRRENVITLHMVHNSHMAAGQVPPHGQLSSVRRYVFERLNTYDAIVLLTEEQKRDVDVAFNSPDNTYVVPNSTELPPWPIARPERETTHGVMLASLTRRKRIDHAVRAIQKANSVAGVPFHLAVYGQGPEQKPLSELISRLRQDAHVQLAGYVSEPRQQLERASFVLLTSTMEGLPLVLLEAMSVGCIPIAYDMPYGPGDVIVDGVNGYLVRVGDVDALASSMVRLGELSADRVAEMRQEARNTAERFGDKAVTARWGQVLHAAVDKKVEATAMAHQQRLGTSN
jgi:poly(glycerol-phosphate) alpha-glucosyltransferase